MFANMEYVPYHKDNRLSSNFNHESMIRRQLSSKEITTGQSDVTPLADQRDQQNDARRLSKPKKQDLSRRDFYRSKILMSRNSPNTGQPIPSIKGNVQKPLLSMYEADKLQQRELIKKSFPPNSQANIWKGPDKLTKPKKSAKPKDVKSPKTNKTPTFHQLVSPRNASRDRLLEKNECSSDESRILKMLTDMPDIKEPKPAKYESGMTEFPINRPLEITPINIAVKEMHTAIQRRVEDAIKNKKIFLIRGDIPYLEDDLRKRGWIQKYESTKTRHLPYGTAACLDAPSLGNLHMPDGTLNEKYAIFNALRSTSPNFIWDCRNDFIDWGSHIGHDTLLNRFQKAFIYTSKLGMTTILDNSHWYNESGVAAVQYPRSYNVIRDSVAFIDDYRRTAAVGFLKWFVANVQQGVELVNKGNSPISPKQIEFAIKRCEEIVNHANDETLDSSEMSVTNQEWDVFLEDYIKTVHEDNGIMELYESCFNEVEHVPLPKFYESAVGVLEKVKRIDQQYELNGMRNIWILKPSNLCCGAGIIMSHKLNHILKKVHDCGRDYFLVQKYIEKPLLVHETKFDVRHWYLVTNSYPLTIWIYKESLLRFSSRRFTFENYHEAIHICNTAIQNRYTRSKNSVRAQEWDCERLNQYLKDIGYVGEPWYDTILPKMRQAIVAIMLAAQDHMDKRKYSFELYGADFMVMDDLSVWLIEINTNPRMHPPSTRITRRLYPDVLESLVKVVMDHPSNPEADTGNFVLAYKQMITDFQPYLGTSMMVQGKSMSESSKSRFDQEFQQAVENLL